MAGRRRINAGLAAGLTTIAGRIQKSRERVFKTAEAAVKADRDFQERLKLAGIQADVLDVAVGEGGRLSVTPAIKTQFDRATLGIDEQARVPLRGGGTRTFLGPQVPKTATPQTPLANARGIGQLQSQIQEIELRNQIAPDIAREQRRAAFPGPQFGFGGFSEDPNAFQRGVLRQQPLPALDLPEQTDTAFLRSQLQQFQQPQQAVQTQTQTQTPIAPTLSPQTQSVIEDIQSGRGSIQELLAKRQQLEAVGVDVDAILRLLGG